MKKNTRQKIRSWVIAVIILFVALMLVLAYMPMLFVPDEAEERDVSGQTTSTLAD